MKDVVNDWKSLSVNETSVVDSQPEMRERLLEEGPTVRRDSQSRVATKQVKKDIRETTESGEGPKLRDKRGDDPRSEEGAGVEVSVTIIGTSIVEVVGIFQKRGVGRRVQRPTNQDSQRGREPSV